MIYLVSSFHRSGSSMMMRCLIAGGMTAVWDNDQDQLNLIWGRGNYLPNPNGFYALDEREFNRPDFVDEYDGHLIKCPYNKLLELPIAAYRLVFLRRSPAEIRTSMAQFTPGRSWAKNEALTYLYIPIMAELHQRILARGDVTLTILQYAEIVAHPHIEFAKLAKAGWPIDVTLASRMVEDALYRSRLEVL